jgi:hypothetical protein
MIKIMIKILVKIFQRLENFERNYSRIFWFCIAFLGLSLFHEPIQNRSQSQVVIEQVRGGTKNSDSFIPPLKPESPRTGQQDPSKPKRPGPRQLGNPKPKLTFSRPGNGGGGSGSGSGGGSSWEDENAIPPESRWINDRDYWTDYTYNPNGSSKNKDEEETCSISDELKNKADIDENSQDAARTVTEKLDESNAVKKLVKTALKNQDVKNEYVRIKKRLEEGINPIDIGKKSTPVASNKVLIKGDEGRYLVEVSGNQVNVLGICARGNSKNVKTFESLMNEMYGVNLQY